MDPLSDVLSLLEVRSYAAGGFQVDGDFAVGFPAHEGIKCYAVVSGACWLAVDGAAPLQLQAGDCFLLPRGLAFRLASDLALPPIDAAALRRLHAAKPAAAESDGPYIVGGYFHLAGEHAELLLAALPPVIHIRDEGQKATMRWSLDRLRDEVRRPQLGSSLIAQQLAYTMLIQALRLHLSEATFAVGSAGWLFALADKHMNAAISLIHDDPAHPWTVHELAARVGMSRSVFALRFKETVGATPIDYVTRWRMLRASQRLKSSSDSISEIAASLGYESESAFRKAFRSVMGCSPREYGRG